jgi:WD40 repeat protein
MVLTGCLDGNVRIWDPLRSSAARVSLDGWFPAIAMHAEVVAAGGEDGQIQLWNVTSGDRYSPLPVGRAYPGEKKNYLPRGRRLRLGGSHARTLVSQDADRITVWDLTDVSSPVLQTEASFLNLRALDLLVIGDSGRALIARLDHEERVRVTDLVADATLFEKRLNGADSVLFIDAPGRPLLGVGARDKLHLLDVESGKRIRAPLPARLPPHAAVGRLDGADVLAVLDSDGLRFFDIETGKQTISQVEMSTTPKGVAWGRVGDRDVVVTAHFATVRVWNPRTGRKITELRLGTTIGAISLRDAGDGRLSVAISGPGLVLTELRETFYNSF